LDVGRLTVIEEVRHPGLEVDAHIPVQKNTNSVLSPSRKDMDDFDSDDDSSDLSDNVRRSNVSMSKFLQHGIDRLVIDDKDDHSD